MVTEASKLKKFYHNANIPIVVPMVNVIFEDLVLIVAIGLIGLAASSLTGYVSEFLSILIFVMSAVFVIFLLWFARSKRQDEIDQRGICRTGVVRRYLSYYIGSDLLRGR